MNTFNKVNKKISFTAITRATMDNTMKNIVTDQEMYVDGVTLREKRELIIESRGPDCVSTLIHIPHPINWWQIVQGQICKPEWESGHNCNDRDVGPRGRDI